MNVNEIEEIIAAICHRHRPIYGVQFHPEVDLTVHGNRMLATFLKRICGLRGNYMKKDAM